MNEPLSIDDVVFGNPSSRDHQLMQTETYLDKLLPHLKNFTPPKNSSSVAITELNTLLAHSLLRKPEKNKLYDESLLTMIKKTFMDGGADKEFVDTVSTGVADDVIPLLTKLKYHFNRPRPGQLAHYYGINLFPDHSYFTNNPSFPSGHTCLTVVTCNVLGNLYPEMFKKMLPVIKEVMDSRVSLGVHFPSDNDMSMVVAKSILANPEFKANYHL